jgi:hypothetical protein
MVMVMVMVEEREEGAGRQDSWLLLLPLQKTTILSLVAILLALCNCQIW